MRRLMGIITVFIVISLSCVHVYAIQIQNGNETNVIGQVTITNLDSADNNKRLNGAHIKITDRETGKVYTEIIKDDGMLIYELPLGSYWLAQELAPDNYALNSRVFEFTLQVPPGPDAQNVKIVNASVILTNDLIGRESNAAEPELRAATEAKPPEIVTPAPVATPTPAPLSPLAQSKEESDQAQLADKNPATEDNSIVLLALIAFFVMILLGCAISLKHINSRL